MPIIRPVSDLRNNFAAISQMVHTEDEPVFLTKNGIGSMVVMSLSYYEKELARTELYKKLQQAHDEIANGATGKDARTVLKGLLTECLQCKRGAARIIRIRVLPEIAGKLLTL